MRSILPLMLVTLLNACAGSAPPETVRYLLRAEQPPGQRSAVETPRVGIGRIVVPPYLNQLGIVLETEPGQVRAARHHLWAEPFDQGLTHYLRQALSAEMGVDVSIDPAQRGAWDYRLDVRFEEFHGTEDGNVHMTVEYSWTAASSGNSGQRSMFSGVAPMSGDGYAAMVAAHEALLARLVGAMTASVPVSVSLR